MWGAIEHLGRDGRTGGYLRDAWSPADLELREWFRQEAARRGLDLREDRNGNLWAWRGDPSRRPGVVTGSHLDSVRQGGAFDGPLGVVSAFAALDLLDARGFRPGRPLGIACFTDEEGARFGVPCTGSRLLTGVLDPDRARGLTDDDGSSLADVLRRAGRDPGALGRDDETLGHLGVFVELHVEQGRGLVHAGAPVGVASAIWPHGRWRFDFRGRADHAGTTRLEDRDDPMLPFARTVLRAREAARRRGVVATFGRLRVSPGSANAIPGLVSAWLDARGGDTGAVRALVAELTESSGAEVREESWTPAVDFDAALRDRLASAAGTAVAAALSSGPSAHRPAAGPPAEDPRHPEARHPEARHPEGGSAQDPAAGPVPVLPTGAGHDAGILAAAGVPSAMVFVRNPTGISHSPEEHAEASDCHLGVAALAATLEELCRS
ncbi:allantoate amidohydrolase [Planomonospora sphaerica]|uniref:Allantoate amidohydrolase n=1 Tax=Planomonospora sphaerica TaxID=161355 RepID=A0A171BT31_9ACTN|nr:allantoate amidohydrolase [Planomonospora sphaerica]GAT65528.1 allantoate amidohydrolase [Planomonospora sphaerica]